MIYREAGQFRVTYAADQRIFPIVQDRVSMALLLAAAFVGVPLLASEYALSALLIPMLVLALAALGLNILTGYADSSASGRRRSCRWARSRPTTSSSGCPGSRCW